VWCYGACCFRSEGCFGGHVDRDEGVSCVQARLQSGVSWGREGSNWECTCNRLLRSCFGSG
jgi:hypothetical protein